MGLTVKAGRIKVVAIGSLAAAKRRMWEAQEMK